jgi:hypothetical protein
VRSQVGQAGRLLKPKTVRLSINIISLAGSALPRQGTGSKVSGILEKSLEISQAISRLVRGVGPSSGASSVPFPDQFRPDGGQHLQ